MTNQYDSWVGKKVIKNSFDSSEYLVINVYGVYGWLESRLDCLPFTVKLSEGWELVMPFKVGDKVVYKKYPDNEYIVISIVDDKCWVQHTSREFDGVYSVNHFRKVS